MRTIEWKRRGNRDPSVFAPVLLLGALVSGLLLTAQGAALAAAPEVEARRILDLTGVRGGLVVHLGCGDGRLTAALRAGGSYLVHGLGRDAASIEVVREHLRSLGLYGPASVDEWPGDRLPYIDNLVNLVVCDDLGDTTMEEVLRVLAPQGVACIKQDGVWTRTVKPSPAEMDHWTHYLYDSSNNAVSKDSLVGPPRHFQWLGSPRWSRHHDHMSSISAMVSAGGRVFHILDEGPLSSILLPPKWMLTARDAFNGKILWQRSIDKWFDTLLPLKSGPATLPRRLVAVGDRVFVTLGIDAPVAALEAASGETVREYEGTAGAQEIVHSGDTLFVVTHQGVQQHFERGVGRLIALEANSGKPLWTRKSTVLPLTLTAGEGRVLFHDGRAVVCLDRRTGGRLWESQPLPSMEETPLWFAPTLVLYQDVVLFAGGENMEPHKGGHDTLAALDAGSGKVLWKGAHPASGYQSPEDVLVAGGLVWCGAVTLGGDWAKRFEPKNGTGILSGYDPWTGELKESFAPQEWEQHIAHHRCHRAKATERFLLMSRTGIECVDFRTKHWTTDLWVRGGCLYGIMPAGGLIYTPPHPCACFIEAKLSGFCALAAARTALPEPAPGEAGRLRKGPVLGAVVERVLSPALAWPTYRGDNARSGRYRGPLSSRLEKKWRLPLGGRLTPPVMAGGRIMVADIDAHTLHAVSTGGGDRLWHYTAGGRIDSPPTLWRGLVLFGSADGWVYCLRGRDGALLWRFRAAPAERRMAANEQLESVWPVHGSVLVTDGVVHCVAGRSIFLDGGLRYLRLDAASGRLLSETVLDRRDPDTGKDILSLLEWPYLPVALADILTSDGRRVYMGSQPFDLEGRRTEFVMARNHSGQLRPPAFQNEKRRTPIALLEDDKSQQGEGAHLFAPTGLLDDSWWHRTYWTYGKNFHGGAGGYFRAGMYAPSGRILAIDDDTVYGFGRDPHRYGWITPMEYRLFAAPKDAEIVVGERRGKSKQPDTYTTTWSRKVPLLARAMVLADRSLLVCGPPDLVDEDAVKNGEGDPAKLERQSAALDGAEGALLWVVNKHDGARVSEYRLEEMPVFDGMAAAGGSLYLCTVEGSLLCLGPRD